jgi:hypothetical protein
VALAIDHDHRLERRHFAAVTWAGERKEKVDQSHSG